MVGAEQMAAEPLLCFTDLLTTDLSIVILMHLPAEALCRASCVCRSLQQMAASNAALLWGRLMQGAQLAPYTEGAAASVENFRATEQRRNSWHGAHGTHHFIVFDSYVRALRVDAAAKTLVVGLHSGRTHIYCWDDAGGAATQTKANEPQELLGCHEAQVVTSLLAHDPLLHPAPAC